ncbi:MAG: type II toxin-antitoxin system HicA family toxin [Deltaproteobacteria bacterium]|nr:type II toxin-antitoxin system HicA family toxin [Deltaproteobacteria bacterium]
MGGPEDILTQARNNPRDVRFSELVRLVLALGYELRRTAGSHHIFKAPGLPLINLQEVGGKAKPYQVRQVLALVDQYKLEVK